MDSPEAVLMLLLLTFLSCKVRRLCAHTSTQAKIIALFQLYIRCSCPKQDEVRCFCRMMISLLDLKGLIKCSLGYSHILLTDSVALYFPPSWLFRSLCLKCAICFLCEVMLQLSPWTVWRNEMNQQHKKDQINIICTARSVLANLYRPSLSVSSKKQYYRFTFLHFIVRIVLKVLMCSRLAHCFSSTFRFSLMFLSLVL